MQILANGLLQGVLIGAVAVAFGIVYRTTGIFHVALGGIVALAPYVVLACRDAGAPASLSWAVAVVAGALLGVLLEKLNHRPLSRRRAPLMVHLIASLGAYLVAVQAIALIWGNETRVLREGLDQVWIFGSATLARAQLLGPLLALSATMAMMVWLRRAERGLELRALADDPVLAALAGRDVDKLRLWVFGLSGALAALASVARAWDAGFAPGVGLDVVLAAMAAAIIGGSGGVAAPLLGGLVLGLMRASVVWFGSARWDNAATFLLLAIFLLLRPQGIIPRRLRVEEVE